MNTVSKIINFKFTIHFATINTSTNKISGEKIDGFTIHFATINTLYL